MYATVIFLIFATATAAAVPFIAMDIFCFTVSLLMNREKNTKIEFSIIYVVRGNYFRIGSIHQFIVTNCQQNTK